MTKQCHLHELLTLKHPIKYFLSYYIHRYIMYKYTIAIVGQDSISSLYITFRLLLYVVLKKKNAYIYIRCYELTVPAVTCILRHMLGYLVTCNGESTHASTVVRTLCTYRLVVRAVHLHS